jgi:hypothetical protein
MILLVAALLCIGTGRGFAANSYATVVVPPDKIIGATKFLADVAAKINVTYMIYNSLTPKIVLSGDSERVAEVKKLLEKFNSQDSFKELIYVNCCMETLNEGDIKDIGILPASGISAHGYVNLNSNTVDQLGNVFPTWMLRLDTIDDLAVIKLQETLNNGQITAAGEMTLPNGIGGILQAKESLPLHVTGIWDVQNVTYKDVPTEIKITPTMVAYDKDNPANSLIKLDINMSFGYVSDVSTGAGGLPFVGSRETNTSRIVRANDQTYIVAGLVRDKLIKANTGIPILRDIPLLKYLFSENYTRTAREYGILKLNVHLINPDGTLIKKIVDKLEKNPKELPIDNNVPAADGDTNLLQQARANAAAKNNSAVIQNN